ncbi:MAG: hypothetical protein HYZ00_12930 [Candidatus Hydrogenedentes bacterium]|nr:hypothetical protein [Candidatus Hydrogenedentota bacterium]
MRTFKKLGRKNVLPGIIAFTALACLATTLANAQGGRGPQLPPEKREAAWALEAGSVAKDLGLAEDAAKKLADAYKASRQGLQAEMEKLTPGGDRGGIMEKLGEINKTEREKLQKAIGEFLTPEQTEKAVASLGTFHRQWDRYVDTVAGLKLEAEKQDQALSLITKHVVDSSAQMTQAMESGDFQSVRESMQASKESLDSALAGVLSAEQLATWKEQTARGRRGGPGGLGGLPGAPGAPPAPAAGQGDQPAAGAPATPAAPAAPAESAAPAAPAEPKKKGAEKRDE